MLLRRHVTHGSRRTGARHLLPLPLLPASNRQRVPDLGLVRRGSDRIAHGGNARLYRFGEQPGRRLHLLRPLRLNGVLAHQAKAWPLRHCGRLLRGRGLSVAELRAPWQVPTRLGEEARDHRQLRRVGARRKDGPFIGVTAIKALLTEFLGGERRFPSAFRGHTRDRLSR